MLTTKELRGVKVCRPPKPGKEYTKDGVPRRKRKIGKIFKTVFSPDGMQVVGFIVRQPDLLWMIKRPDRFLALDSFDVVDDVLVATNGADSWDDRAIKRLELDYDTCILWEGIQVRDTGGADLGSVDAISFDERTGRVNSFFLDDGGTARALLGSIEIPAELVIGYRKGYLIVKDEAAYLMPSGGLAAKAGAATAKVGNDAREGVKKAGEATAKAAGQAVEKGSEGIGKLIGRTKNMVTETRDEFRKSSGAAERAAEKAAAERAEAQQAAAAKASAGKGSSAKAASSAAKVPAGSGAAKPSGSKPADKASSGKSSSKGAAGAVAEHMKSAGSMFSDFKKEFDKAKKS